MAEAAAGAIELQLGGRSYSVETGRGRGRQRREDADHFVDGEWHMRTPLTGVVIELRVAAGDAVEAGSVLAIVEAMKMLNELRTPVPGRVSAVHTTQGSRVEIGERLLTVRAVEAAQPPGDASSP